MRRFSTKNNGSSFDEATLEAVWRKGSIVPGSDSATWRRDQCGALMRRRDYGDTNSQYGWEVDHIMPISQGGSDALQNLQPLHWRNNRHKSDNWPSWSCAVR